MFAAVLGILGWGILQLIPAKIPVAKKVIMNPIVQYVWCALVFGISLMLLASNTYNPFIYFRF
jgi:alginate O-acetyltransferase complex protein AlgI